MEVAWVMSVVTCYNKGLPTVGQDNLSPLVLREWGPGQQSSHFISQSLNLHTVPLGNVVICFFYVFVSER